jgi:deoxyribonuclease-4
MELGLKLWSSNTHLLEEASRLVGEKVFAYIEVSVVPGTDPSPFVDTHVPYVVHAATERNGIDIGNPRLRATNVRALHDCIRWADMLGAERIIVHPGSGNLADALDFLRDISDDRICIENMPRAGLGGETLIGAGREELNALIGERFGFCLDLNHAVKAAASEGVEYHAYIRDLLTLTPVIFHLADGHGAVPADEHLPIGAGDYDIGFMVRCVAESSAPRVTLETPRASMGSLDEDRAAAEAIARYL